MKSTAVSVAEANAPTQRQPEHGADSSEYRQHPHDEDGPEEIELLLDRQGPGVREGRRGPGRGEVVRSLCDEVPIGDVERRTEDVPAEGRIGPRWERQLRDEHHRDDQEEQSRQKPTRPPGPEVSEPDAPAALHFGQQQGGDQESGENEEGVDSEIATGQPADASVVGEDARDSKGPHPIECGNVAEARVLALSAFSVRPPSSLLPGRQSGDSHVRGDGRYLVPGLEPEDPCDTGTAGCGRGAGPTERDTQPSTLVYPDDQDGCATPPEEQRPTSFRRLPLGPPSAARSAVCRSVAGLNRRRPWVRA